MQLTCIVPGWHAAVMNRATGRGADPAAEHDVHAPPGAAADRAAAGPAIEEIGVGLRVRPGAAPCWWTATLGALGMEAEGGLASATPPVGAPAANDWLERTGREPPAGRLLRADPVSLRADRDSAILRPPGVLGLDDDESRRLVADLNAFLADDGLVLHAPTPASWYLSGDLPLRLGPSPDALAFRTLEASLDEAHDAVPVEDRAARRRLRTLHSEIEMLLHTHPVNVARRSSQRLAVTGLHLWGAAVPLVADAARQASPPADRHRGAGVRLPDLVIGDAAFVRHAAAAAGVRREEALTTPSATSGGDGATVLVVDLSLRAAWLSGDGAALERARANFVAHRLQPLHGAGFDPAWRPASGTGLRIVAESGWCHEGEPPPRGTIATAAARIASRAASLLRRARPERSGR